MPVKECSLYQFKTKNGGTVNTTPKDLTARKMGDKLSGLVSAGGSVTLTVDLTVPRILITGHGSVAGLRSIYILGSSVCSCVMAGANITASMSGNTLTITSTASSGAARYQVL